MSRPKGFVLGIVIGLIPVLAILSLGLIISLRGGTGSTQMHHARTATLYVAEAGIVDALGQLESTNMNWTAGFNQKQMHSSEGTYSVVFNQSGSGLTASHSVNNFDGLHPHSYRGPDTVPAGTVLIVVTAQVRGVERRLEALVRPQSSSVALSHPLLTSGRIRLSGDVSIDGIKALDDSSLVNANVHSNNTADNTTDVISWDGSGALSIDGEVTAAGSSASTVNLGSGTVTGGISTQSSPVAIPPVNIVSEIAMKTGATSPPINPFGTSTLSSDDFYHNGDLTINGDLVLDEGSLYVNGTLTVNGSIGGKGSVYVGKETTFQGDSAINGQGHIALFSKGSVMLQGFDGQKYLDDLAATKPNVANYWNKTKNTMTTLLTSMNSGSWSGSEGTVETAIDDLAAFPAYPEGAEGAGYIHHLKNELNLEPPGPTRDFLLERLSTIENMLTGNANFSQTDQEAIDNFNATGVPNGLLDAVNDLTTSLRPAAYNLVKEVDYDKIGYSTFQGLIYTNGAFYSGNEINVIGAVIVNSDGTQPPIDIGGVTLEPGDLFLDKGTNVTFVEELFDDSGNSGTTGPPAVVLWMGR